jgi:2-C-methyl-D-erythritol 4-phosphate cytidylyltransferase
VLLQRNAGGKVASRSSSASGIAIVHDAARQHLFANVFQRLLAGTEMNAGTNKQLTHKSSLLQAISDEQP